MIRPIERAAALSLNGECPGIVTNPINKAALYDAGLANPSHTELLDVLTGGRGKHADESRPAPVPVTVRASLRDSVAMLTTNTIVASAQNAAATSQRDLALRVRRAIADPNPHAGEQGALDDEGLVGRRLLHCLLVASKCRVARRPGRCDVHGKARRRYEATICMYRDQALIPLKTLDMGRGVSATLGLPIARISHDYGTAYDIAEEGIANPAGPIAAIELAATLVESCCG